MEEIPQGKIQGCTSPDGVGRKQQEAVLPGAYPARGDKSYEDANVPVFRLSELYLNAAEAAVKNNDITNARAYLKPVYARTGGDLDDLADKSITLDLVLEQRRIEFWGEGQRFD